MFIQSFAGLLTLVGAVWLLQGLGLIKGSFMTGSPLWGAIGAALLIIGLVTLAVKRRRARTASNHNEPA